MTDFEKIKKRYEDHYAPTTPDAVQNYIFALEVSRMRAKARVHELEAANRLRLAMLEPKHKIIADIADLDEG